jgi:hypothetical protein
MPVTRQELAPAVSFQQAVDRALMHRMADTLLIGTLDFPGGRDLPLDGSRKEGREQLPLLLPGEQLIMTAAFAHRLHCLDPQSIVGLDQGMHRRFGDTALLAISAAVRGTTCAV